MIWENLTSTSLSITKAIIIGGNGFIELFMFSNFDGDLDGVEDLDGIVEEIAEVRSGFNDLVIFMRIYKKKKMGFIQIEVLNKG